MQFLKKSLISITIPVTGYLGYWQLERREWKLDLIRKSEERPLLPPLEGIPHDFHLHPQQYEYRKLKVTGRYDHSRELRVIPRSYISPGGKAIPSKFLPEIARERTGAQIVTGFVTRDGRRMLVNRGFASWSYVDPETRKRGQVETEHEISGIIRLDDASLRGDEGKQTSDGQYSLRDVTNMSTELKTEAIFIDLDREYSAEGGPIGGQTHFNFSNNHLLYTIH